MSVDGWMNKENAAYTYMEYYNLKKKGSPIICCNLINLEDNHVKWSNPLIRTITAQFHLFGVSEVIKLIEAESRLVIAREWGEEETRLALEMGVEF